MLENKDEVKIQSTSILSEGYGLIPKKITRDKSLTMESKAIYGYLASFAGTGGQCYPSKTLMISELGTTEVALILRSISSAPVGWFCLMFPCLPPCPRSVPLPANWVPAGETKVQSGRIQAFEAWIRFFGA